MISLRSRIAIWLTLSALLWVGVIALSGWVARIAAWAFEVAGKVLGIMP